MRPLITVLLLGGALVGAPALLQLSPASAALVSIAAGVLVSAAACALLDARAVAAGSLAALSLHAVGESAPVMAGALFVALALAPRGLRARSRRDLGAHLALSLVGGAMASAVALHHGGAATAAVRMAALAVAGLLASLPLFVAVDDAVAAALARAAMETPGDAGDALSRAVALRRRIEHSPAVEALADSTARHLERAWDALVAIVGQRAAMDSLGTTAVSVLDRRIAQHVEALERIHTSADERFARSAGLTDASLAAARIEAETLETEVRALVEVAPN